MKKVKQPIRQNIKLMTMILALALLPFALQKLEQRIETQRRGVASSEDIKSTSHTESFDLSELESEEFTKAFKYQVMAGLQIIQNPQGQGLRLGHFMLKDEKGGKAFACGRYPEVELIFEAEGIAISGEVPKMVVRGPCMESDDHKFIEAFIIPFTEIFTSPTAQDTFEFNIGDSREKAQVKFLNVVESWPKKWNLIGFKLHSPHDGKTLDMNGYEIISILGEPLQLDLDSTE